jgi:hypothetical protein
MIADLDNHLRSRTSAASAAIDAIPAATDGWAEVR